MKIFKKVSIISLAMMFAFGLAGVTGAATFVSLGNADNFAILAGTGITFTGGVSTINITGDIGSYATDTINNFGAVVLVGSNHAGDGTTQLAKTALSDAYDIAAGQTLPAVTAVTASGVDSFGLGTLNNGAALSPGIYNSGSTMGITGPLTLNGGGDPDAVFIFQVGSSLTTAGASSVVLTNGTQACNVFWQVVDSATLGSASFFKGNILAQTSITLGTTANVQGRVLAQNGAVVLDGSNTITTAKCLPKLTVTKTVINTGGGTKGVGDFPLFLDGMSITSGVASTTTAALHTVSETTDANYTSVIGGGCATNGTITMTAGNTYACSITNTYVPPTSSSPNRDNTLTVVKQVINDSGGKAKYSDFPLFVNGQSVGSGESIGLTAGIYTVTETNLPGYTRTFTGNCDTNGRVNHGGIGSNNSICTVVNDDIGVPAVPPVPPLIDVVKVPSPLALLNGPGSVTYTYTARNIGTVPMTNVTLVGDTCSPIVLDSGDSNGDAKLDVTETWIYHCATTLAATHTNIVTAIGHANGLEAIDVASATVVVSVPGLPETAILPPLIHITKVPSPLTLPAGAGTVTYTKKVTNPGTVVLSNVKVTDDKCNSVKYISGDANSDSLLAPGETWTYTCKTRLTKTTTNTAIATGEANGLIATDFALATVVVAVPKLPNTGIFSEANGMARNAAVLAGILMLGLTSLVIWRKRTI